MRHQLPQQVNSDPEGYPIQQRPKRELISIRESIH